MRHRPRAPPVRPSGQMRFHQAKSGRQKGIDAPPRPTMRTCPGSHAGVGAEAKNRVATKSEEAWAGRGVVKILIFTVKNLETQKKCITFVAQKI